METEFSWTTERVALLTELWEEGLTTAEIGRRMGITKNAVIGKVHRIALTPRVVLARPEPRKNVLDFTGPVCLWPFGHPGDANFHFCGKQPIAGKPYCQDHAAVAYIRPKEQKPNAA
jgi:GcrA cell cycle regulator